MTQRHLSSRLFWLLLSVFALFSSSRTAFAAGTVTATPAVLDEVDGQWKLKLKIDYGSMPEQQYIPVLFGFEQVVLYERSYTDEGGDKPVLNRKSLVNQPLINIDQVIGFSDGTGKLFKGTNFTFVIRRDRGFEAGEYQVTIKKSDGGAALGQKFRITLKGENTIVDRRAITFVGDKAKKKEDKPKPPPSDAPSENTEAPLPEDGGTSEPPPAVPPKQGGCGCRVGVPESGRRWGLVSAGALLMVLQRRMRRQSRVRSAFGE